MNTVLVDSNVLLDVFTRDAVWYTWSSTSLEQLSQDYLVAINPIIYAEISGRFSSIELLESSLPQGYFTKLDLPYEAAFLAGKAFRQYKKRGGQKTSPLSDFFIGAHAAISKMPLMTRDPSHYNAYFPTVELITPSKH